MRAALLAVLIACVLPVAAQQLKPGEPPIVAPAPGQGATDPLPFAKPQGIYATINMSGTESAVRQLGQLIPYERRSAIAMAVPAAPRLSPPVLYALANAMSLDDKNIEESIFWYHVARLRAVYDALRCKDASARQAVAILGKGVSPDIMRSQRQRRARTLEIAQLAMQWDLNNPRNYDHRWVNLYGKVARNSAGTDPTELTVPESEWPAILQRVHEAHLKSVQAFVEQKT